MEQGDIVLVRFPYSNRIDYKIRPAIIISNNNLNIKNEPWVCPITTKKQSHTLLINNFILDGKLDCASYVKTNVIATVEKYLVLKKLGRLSKKGLDKVSSSIKKNI